MTVRGYVPVVRNVDQLDKNINLRNLLFSAQLTPTFY